MSREFEGSSGQADEQGGWERIYRIAAVIGLTGTGGAAVAEILYTYGSSLKTIVIGLTLALCLSLVTILYIVTEHVG